MSASFCMRVAVTGCPAELVTEPTFNSVVVRNSTRLFPGLLYPRNHRLNTGTSTAKDCEARATLVVASMFRTAVSSWINPGPPDRSVLQAPAFIETITDDLASAPTIVGKITRGTGSNKGANGCAALNATRRFLGT